MFLKTIAIYTLVVIGLTWTAISLGLPSWLVVLVPGLVYFLLVVWRRATE